MHIQELSELQKLPTSISHNLCHTTNATMKYIPPGLWLSTFVLSPSMEDLGSVLRENNGCDDKILAITQFKLSVGKRLVL